ncbi:hypothetical protein J6590_036742 [Homalodisca vitripennis]|nr:hypothetical protein J6590_036742 [Homalodisca vitripennis]
MLESPGTSEMKKVGTSTQDIFPLCSLTKVNTGGSPNSVANCTGKRIKNGALWRKWCQLQLVKGLQSVALNFPPLAWSPTEIAVLGRFPSCIQCEVS